MPPTTLRFKVGVYPALALLAALALFAVLRVRHQREELRGETVKHVTQLSEVLIQSHVSMMITAAREPHVLLNEPSWLT